MNRRTVILATLALALSHLAKAQSTMTQDERLLLITCAAAILSLPQTVGDTNRLTKAELDEMCQMAGVHEGDRIVPVLFARLRRVA